MVKKKINQLLSATIVCSLVSLSVAAQDVYVNIENKAAQRFISEVTYTKESESRVHEFMNLADGRSDWPIPAVVNVPETEADSLLLVVSEKIDFANADTLGVSGGESSVNVYNLIPHRVYHYKLITLSEEVLKQGHIYTNGRLRMIGVPMGGFNIRDMGGWPTADGRTVKYGRLYRGSELNGAHEADSISLARLRHLGIEAEIDVRYTGENNGAGISAFGFKDETMVSDGELYTYLYTNNLSIQTYAFYYETFQNRMRQSFRFINKHLQQGNGVYMHCIWGVDRTGLMAMLLEGLLGVDYDGLMKDYELSCFVGSSKKKNDRDDVINFIEGLSGNTLQEKFNTFFLNFVKVTQEEIDFFRSEMLEEAPVMATYSGTLPVMFVSVDHPINSKFDYVDGTFFIDAMCKEGFESVGSTNELLPVQIRGRGNWTWFGPFEKKPYKIKLEEGMPLLNMGSNKHWALLAHADGSEEAFFRNTAGFELGRQIGLPFTPHQQPVELVINGEYQGLYFLTETVRVGKRRVNITAQADGETDPELVSGAWLVEIDNADEPEHQVIPPLDGTELTRFCVTWHSPENLSGEQYNYLYNEWVSILNDVYTADKTSTAWEEHFNMDMLARYYLVNEMIDHVEAFLGSCFLHKDQGEQKWIMGPLWDLGHAFNDWHPKDTFIWQYKHETEDDWEICIFEEMIKFPRLQECIENLWMDVAADLYADIVNYLLSFANEIAAAAACDHERWPQYGTANIHVSVADCLLKLMKKYDFLVSQWGNPGVANDIQLVTDSRKATIYNLQGQSVTRMQKPGLYIRDGRKYLVK